MLPPGTCAPTLRPCILRIAPARPRALADACARPRCINKPYLDGGYENSSRVFGAAGFDMAPLLRAAAFVPDLDAPGARAPPGAGRAGAPAGPAGSGRAAPADAASATAGARAASRLLLGEASARRLREGRGRGPEERRLRAERAARESGLLRAAPAPGAWPASAPHGCAPGHGPARVAPPQASRLPHAASAVHARAAAPPRRAGRRVLNAAAGA